MLLKEIIQVLVRDKIMRETKTTRYSYRFIKNGLWNYLEQCQTVQGLNLANVAFKDYFETSKLI